MEILFFVEDPGAANFILDIPQKVSNEGVVAQLFASSFASEFLLKRNVAFIDLNKNQEAADILIKYSPKLIVVGTSQNSRSIGLDLIDCGKRLGIPTIGFVDSPADCDYRFRGQSKDPLKHEPDWVLAPDNFTKSILVQLGFRKEKIDICGNPNYKRILKLKSEYDKIGVKKLRHDLNIKDSGSPLIIFIDEHLNSHDKRLFKSEDYLFSGNQNAKNRNEIILSELLLALRSCKIPQNIIVRLHPKSNESGYNIFKNQIQSFSSENDPLKVLYCADIVVGMTSMLLVEALLLGKDVISIIPREVELAWAPQLLWEYIRPVTNSNDLRQALLSNSRMGELANSGSRKMRKKTEADIVNCILEKYKEYA
jgi:hypothetical protein